MMTYRKAYESGAQALREAGVPEARLDARLLLEAVCHTARHDLLAHGDRTLTSEEETAYGEMIRKRSLRIPLQHITGVQEFMGLPFLISEEVLIPRQDTEILVEEVLRHVQDGFSLLDLCTGSGCILLSLLRYTNGCRGIGTDLSAAAVELAKENAEKLGLSERAEFVCGDLYERVTGRYEMIVSNPPYIPTDVVPTLMPEVKEHEPMQALDGHEDGLYFYKRIAEETPAHLTRGGWLFLEIGCDQAAAVCGLLRAAGFREITVKKDYAGLDRVVSGTFY